MDAIWELSIGDKFIVTDTMLLKKFPSLKGREMIVSVIKRSGRRTFIQYTLPQSGSGTLKLITRDVAIKIIGRSKITTLSMFLNQTRYNHTQTKITLNLNGRIEDFDIDSGFWLQNSKNIYAHKLRKYGTEYRVPFSSIVLKSK